MVPAHVLAALNNATPSEQIRVQIPILVEGRPRDWARGTRVIRAKVPLTGVLPLEI